MPTSQLEISTYQNGQTTPDILEVLFAIITTLNSEDLQYVGLSRGDELLAEKLEKIRCKALGLAIIRENHQPVAYGIACREDDIEDIVSDELGFMNLRVAGLLTVVRPTHRGRNLANLVFSQLYPLCAQQGMDYVALLVDKSNVASNRQVAGLGMLLNRQRELLFQITPSVCPATNIYLVPCVKDAENISSQIRTSYDLQNQH